MIDHSLLHPTLTDEDLASGCELAKRYAVATVCVKPYAIEMARRLLDGADTGVCAVVAFPHGNSTPAIKVEEASRAVEAGAVEIDMVVNIGKVLGGDWDYVHKEIGQVAGAVTQGGALLKVIFENDYLEDDHIVRLAEICGTLPVAFIKTSTGYGFVRQANGMYDYRGATDHHLRLMRQHAPAGVQIKAAGGVRTLDDLLRVRALGVTRVGATATESILEEAKRRGF